MGDIKAGEWVRFEYKGKRYYALAEGTVYAGRMMVRLKPNGCPTPNLMPQSDCVRVLPEEATA